MSQDNSDRIIVRKDDLARCRWCGTPESPFWTITRDEQIFCSHECELAASSTSKRLGGIGMLCCGSLFLIPLVYFMIFFPIDSLDPMIFIVCFVLPILSCGIFQYLEGTEGLKYKDREGRYRGVSPIVCTYCSHQNPPNVMACQNCGAQLTKAPFAEDSIPPWLRTTSGVVKCSYCAAFQSYRQVQGLPECLVFCQNCNRLFRPSRQAHVVR